MHFGDRDRLVHLAVDVPVRGDGDEERVHGPGTSSAREASFVVNVVLHGHLLGLENGTAAPAIVFEIKILNTKSSFTRSA